MIVAVFCVAAAMIAGGAWAVFTGWEFIIIERGWTQVLLGGMLITGGLLLGGLGVLATHVKRLAGKLEGLPRSALAPAPVFEAAPEQKRVESAPQQTGPLTDAPIMPPPPRPEQRVEPRVEPLAEPASKPASKPASDIIEKPAGPAISAPAAIALGAAAGAGTAAIASALLSSGAPPRSEEEIAARDVEAESAVSENADAQLRPLGTGGDFAGATAPDAEIPAPDGEDVDMVWGTESPEKQEIVERDLEAQNIETETLEAQDLETEALEAEAAKVDGLHGVDREDVRDVAREPTVSAERLQVEQDEAEQAEAEQDEAEQDEAEPVIPPVEEPAAAPEPEPEPEVEPEERYSPPEAAQQPAAADLAEPLSEEDVREAELRPAELSPASIAEASVEEPPATPLEEPVEELERTLVGTYESGGNIYTMYSDGSIDARTPTGDYHFASLEELKNFIAQGGEDPLA